MKRSRNVFLSVFIMMSICSSLYSQVDVDTEALKINGVMIIVIIASIVIFLILREFWCWYYKINEISDLLRQLLQIQSKLLQQSRSTVVEPSREVRGVVSNKGQDDPELLDLLSKIQKRKAPQ